MGGSEGGDGGDGAQSPQVQGGTQSHAGCGGIKHTSVLAVAPRLFAVKKNSYGRAPQPPVATQPGELSSNRTPSA